MSTRGETQDLDALVLAGGESRRMGRPKALLPLGSTPLIGHVVARLCPLFRRVLVVAREAQGWEGLGLEVLLDDRPERGPLVGLARGLAATDSPWCLVTGCDMPFLSPAVVAYMARDLTGCDVVAVELDGRLQPMPAFYSRRCLLVAQELLAAGVTSLKALLERCRVRRIEAAQLLDIDPDLRSFRDLDTVEEYQEAQRLALKHPDIEEGYEEHSRQQAQE